MKSASLALNRLFPTLTAINNPTAEELRRLARPDETTTNFGVRTLAIMDL